ncbi:hypothetical protein RRG08_025311 [Elysia crispata]|uniref:Sodium/glucose cotransporter 4 n=1 Tax=Elysia crispata TaxID=231223 RepID=A0AAE1ABM7_9GAST|nr:hypothetical protein RRG08_025311 [Elysia crispata]
MVEKLTPNDYVSIGVYFALVLAVGMWSTFRPNRGSTKGYFLAGKTMHWLPVGASIFASNVGAPMFIALPGTAAASGIACAIYEWHAVFLLIALGWIFVPVYVASGCYTMPEYLKKRFGGVRLRIYLSVLTLFLYVLTKISVEIYTGALFMQQLLEWNLFACVGIILFVTALYTVVGGLAAVIYTDTLQTVILLIGSCVLFISSMTDVGGWAAFVDKYMKAASNMTLQDPDNYSCGLPRHDSFHIWRDPVHGDLPWTGTVFGLTVLGMWVWCNDQLMVQRCLAAKNMTHSKGGTVFAAAMKITTFFLFIVPGMISRIFFPDEIACSDPVSCEEACGNTAGCSNMAYPLLVLRKLPEGIRGVMLAALLAALMSSLTSIFNSASTMMTLDLWRRFRTRASQAELMIVGRVSVLILIVVSIIWIPIMEQSQGGQLWNYLQTISACVSPPLCCVFLMALFWKRTTEPGAFWGLMLSTAVGLCRMILEFVYSAPDCGSGDIDERPSVLSKVNFLHFAIIITILSLISIAVISLFTEPRAPEKLHRVTWWTRHDNEDIEDTDSESEEETELNGDVNKDDTISINGDDSVKVKQPKEFYHAFYNWVCGQTDQPRPKLTNEEKKLIKQKMTDIEESPGTSKLLNILAILVCGITVFLLGVFA